MGNSFFDKKIKPAFLYVGFIASGIFSIAYIIVIAIMIMGLETAPTIETFIGFLIANLVTGACISISMMIQGQDFAKDKEENKQILAEYVKKKEVKLHSMTFYWILAIIKTIFTRLLMVAAMTYIVIDICWKGNNQYTYLLMAVFNILMFLGFGMLGLVSMYDKYNNRYIPFIRRKLSEREIKKAMELAEKECIHEEDDSTYDNIRNNLLDTSLHTSNTSSSSEPVVLDNNN